MAMLLSSGQVLAVWEQGLAQDPVERALTILSAAYPDRTRDDLAALSIGRRDSRLLDVHERLFGSALRSYAECPECGASLEFTLDAGELRQDQGPDGERLVEVSLGATQLRCRPPNSRDLGAVLHAESGATARRALSERCVVSTVSDGPPIAVSSLSDDNISTIAAAIAAADPQADTVLSLTCAECHHAWELLVDMLSFLWVELQALAKQLLQQVHALAWAYGWREADILAMSDARRRGYIEMAG